MIARGRQMVARLRGADPGELASLDERLGVLMLTRVTVAVAVVVVAGGAPDLLGAPAAAARQGALVYLALAAAVEIVGRRYDRWRPWLHRLLLPIDALFAVWAAVPQGGRLGAAALLLALQVVAATLLASGRSGGRLAVWDAFLLLAARQHWDINPFALLWSTRSGPNEVAGGIALAAAALIAVSAAAAAAASLGERELRHARDELAALASTTGRLEAQLHPAEILEVLESGLRRALAARRTAAIWEAGEEICVRVWPPAPAEPAPPTTGWIDRSAAAAWRDGSPQLVRRLDPQADPTLSRLLPGAERILILPLGPDAGQRGIFAVEVAGRSRGVAERTVAVAAQFATNATLALRTGRLLAEREELARRDGLTGLLNRRALDEALAAEVARSRRSGAPLSLVIVDLDHFKQLNDRLGHRAGDTALRATARLLARSVRLGDLAARFGGEEFALLLPACGPAGALRVAEAAREAVAAAQLHGLTVSAGVATLPEHAADAGDLVEAADRALYRSKAAGRDRVSLAEAITSPSPTPGD